MGLRWKRSWVFHYLGGNEKIKFWVRDLGGVLHLYVYYYNQKMLRMRDEIAGIVGKKHYRRVKDMFTAVISLVLVLFKKSVK